jgi:hypothetical protein
MSSSSVLLEVLRRLRMAKDVDDTQDRDTIFRQLIADLAGEMGSKAEANVKGLSKGEDKMVGAEKNGSGRSHRRFYEALAGQIPLEDGDTVGELLVEFEHLWLHSKVPLIFAAIFYKFFFVKDSKAKIKNSKRDKYNSVLVTGMKHLFWSDLHTESKRFEKLFTFLTDEVVLSDVGIDKLSSRAQLECAKMVARFSLYYQSAEKLAQIVLSFPANLDYGANILDFFLKEIMGMIRKIKVEGVAAGYLRSLSSLHEIIPFSKQVSLNTTTRVQEVLFGLSQPGGPYYAPRQVRRAARETFGSIYPNGKYFRALLKLSTSLLHPAYSANAVVAGVVAVGHKYFGFLLYLISSVREMIFNLWAKLQRGRVNS